MEKESNVIENLKQFKHDIFAQPNNNMKGIITNNGEYIKHEDEKDMLRMGGGSWTINLDWASEGVKVITYITEKNKYQITMEDAIKYGFERTFQGERKLVVPISKWTKI